MREGAVPGQHVLDLSAKVVRQIFNPGYTNSDHGPLDGPDLGEAYRLLHQAAAEAEAAWSLLPDRGDGTRVFSANTALLRISLLLVERDVDLIVIDIRIPRPTIMSTVKTPVTATGDSHIVAITYRPTGLAPQSDNANPQRPDQPEH